MHSMEGCVYLDLHIMYGAVYINLDLHIMYGAVYFGIHIFYLHMWVGHGQY